MKGPVGGLKRGAGATPAQEIAQLAAFTVGEQHYALDIMRIKEIINPLPITPVPKAPAFIEGVIELRGAILPIVDMRKRFDLPPSPPSRSTKYLIVSIDRLPSRDGAEPPGRWIVGLIVDGVHEVIRVPKNEIRPAPAMALNAEARYFGGVCHHRERIVMVLDLEAILSSGERATLEKFGAREGS